MVDESENRVPEEARQRYHKELQDLLAAFLAVFEQGSHSGGSMVSEPPQVSHIQQCFLCVIPRYVRNCEELPFSVTVNTNSCASEQVSTNTVAHLFHC